MPVVQKKTSDITFQGTLVTVQMSLTSTNTFSDTAPSDDLGGPGPYLVFERGIWKYPQQASGGRVEIPRKVGRPVRLSHIMANFGASADWELHVAGIDGTGQRPNNTSGTPYDSADAALYQEGDVIVASGTSQQYVSSNVDPFDSNTSAYIHPGQHVYLTTTAGSNAIVRLTFTIAKENVG